jgi:steroid 5-alpha reductase family enzyme
MTFSAYASGLYAALALAVLTWIVSVIKRDVSIVDSVWSLMILAAALAYFLRAEPGLRSSFILTLAVIWALRLALHITWRNWGEPEDRRYQAIRRRYEPHFALKSLGIIFVFQAILAWLVSMPLWAAVPVPPGFSLFDVAAVALWGIGMGFETVADWQLARFKADPSNRGKVMDRGLWRYTRHPNYFGECLVWWGFFLFAVPTGAWWTVISPLLMTWLLLKVSGITLLEASIVTRRPAYREYIAATNAFIPGPRKRGLASDHQVRA